MQEGIFYDLTTDDARAHFESRKEYHLAKARDYEQKIAALASLALELEHQSNDPRQQLEASKGAHERQARIFAFRAEFIVQNQTFRLSEGDLRSLEFLDRYGF